mgnify:CR=1 FL=1
MDIDVDDYRDVTEVERIGFEGVYLDDSGEEDGIINPFDYSWNQFGGGGRRS